MFRIARASCAFLLSMLVLLPVAVVSADEINVESAAVSFREVDGERIATFLHFTATTGEFSLSSPSGRYSEASEVMTAAGDDVQRAVLTKGGENPFDVSAAIEIAINFDDETLAAAGDVAFRSGDLDARSDELFVDRRRDLEARIAALASKIAMAETIRLLESFLAKVNPDDRLILLSGNVRLTREDSTMESAWVLVNEADQSELISVADPDRSVRFTIVPTEEPNGEGSQD